MRKPILALCTLAAALILPGCAKTPPPDDGPAVVRTFLAGCEAEDHSSRILLNLLEDGSAAFYVGALENGIHTTAQYHAAYALGENAAYDETIRLTHEDSSATDATIVDGVFEMDTIRFYETAPVSMEGDVYVGYLTKTSGMGPMVYAYALCLGEDATFDVSIMQMASVMHVWGSTGGTYKAKDENITFTYDILTEDGDLVTADAVAEGTGFDGNSLAAAFNIQQNTMRPTDAVFIKVKEHHHEQSKT